MANKTKTCFEQVFSFETGERGTNRKAPALPPENEVAPPFTGADAWGADAAPAIGAGSTLGASRLDSARPMRAYRAA